MFIKVRENDNTTRYCFLGLKKYVGFLMPEVLYCDVVQYLCTTISHGSYVLEKRKEKRNYATHQNHPAHK